MSDSPTPPTNNDGMKVYGSPHEILDVILLVKDSLVQMLIASGVDPTKTRQTARMLELDHNYVWPATKINNTDDILVVAEHIPTVKRMEVLCTACRKHGASEESIEAVREAMQQFEEMVKHSAGDREGFSDLMHGLSYDDVTSRQEATRKMAFRAQSSLWGVQASVNFKTVIHSPVADAPDHFDCIRLGGLVGLRRLRPVPWSVYRMFAFNEDGSPTEQDYMPLDPELSSDFGLPMLKEFCTQPMPEINPVPTAHGKRFDIASGAIGNIGAIDCVFGDLLPNFDSIYQSEDDKFQSAMIDLQTPAEMLLFDFFVHRDLPFPLPPSVMHLDRLNAARGYSTKVNEWNQLPLSAKVREMAPGSVGCSAPFYPQYREIVDYAFSRLGHTARDFRGFRFTMTYPTIPSAVVMHMAKLPVPGEA